MTEPRSRPASLLFAALLPLAISGCADTLSPSPERFTDAVKPYEKTLSQDQQKAAITELQTDQAKHDKDQAARKQEEAADGDTASATPASNRN